MTLNYIVELQARGVGFLLFYMEKNSDFIMELLGRLSFCATLLIAIYGA